MSIYEQDGVEVTTHSMLESFSRCPNKARYAYYERLKPKTVTKRQKPLKRGTWFHALLEDYYAGRDWKATHQTMVEQYSQLFDEEKDALGDLPTEMVTLMRAYLWHYGASKEDPYHGWNIYETEVMLECEWPDGKGIYRCKLDAIGEDEFGQIIIDHKTHDTLPGHDYRLLDHASVRYLWCAGENGYDTNRFVWNYIKAKAPTKPKLAYAGTARERLSTQHVETDFPTYLRALKEYGLPLADHKDKLKALKAVRWKRGEPQTSPFFRRDELEKDEGMIDRVLAASMKTRDRMHSYDWDDTQSVERVVDRSCGWCEFKNLCMAELFDGNADLIRRRDFKVGNPLGYYDAGKGIME